MPKLEAQTDIFVNDLLRKSHISLTPQGAGNVDIDQALRAASKNGTGNCGHPDFCGIVNEFAIVVENKASLSDHEKMIDGKVDMSTAAIKRYALNGAVYYAKTIVAGSPYDKLFGFGVSGNGSGYRITPFFLQRGMNEPIIFDNVDDFNSFSHDNIKQFYCRYVLGEKIDANKSTTEIKNDAAILHEALRNYGTLTTEQKPLVVSGILLALSETEYGGMNIETLTGDTEKTDGQKIVTAIKTCLKRKRVENSILLNQFAFIETNVQINSIDKNLGKTPVRYFTEFLYRNIYKNIRYTSAPDDFIGQFYGEFISYSGGDGQTLGIILTPTHITELFCDLVDLKPDDKVLDPCCGTGGFLVSAMHRMTEMSDKSDGSIKRIKAVQLHGIEMQDYMYSIAFTNLLLRNCNTDNLTCCDFFKLNTNDLNSHGFTVGMINPPYSQGSEKNPGLYEMNFVLRMLGCLSVGGRGVAIVPKSVLTNKTQTTREIKELILHKHTLECVISLNPNTFYGVGISPCICVFTANIPHPKNKRCKFIDFSDDGYAVEKHRGLVMRPDANERKARFLGILQGKVNDSGICVEHVISADDEWLFENFINVNRATGKIAFENIRFDYDEFIGTFLSHIKSKANADLVKSISTTLNGILSICNLELPSAKQWKEYRLDEIFQTITRGTRIRASTPGDIPYITASCSNNGIAKYVEADEKCIYSDCLTVPAIGGAESAFYHSGNFVPSQDVQVLINKNFNEYIYRFIGVVLGQLMKKYSFGYKASIDRLSKQEIPLPATKTGEPDYGFMANYMRIMAIDAFAKRIEKLKQKLDE